MRQEFTPSSSCTTLSTFFKCIRPRWLQCISSLAFLHRNKPAAHLLYVICTSEHLYNSKLHTGGVRKPHAEGCCKNIPTDRNEKMLGIKHLECDVKTRYFHKLTCRISLEVWEEGVLFDFEWSHPHVVDIFNNLHLQICICYTEYK